MIKQGLVSKHIDFFKNDFLKRWNLVEYYNSEEPCVFFGGHDLSKQIELHNSFKVVILSSPTDLPNFDIVKNRKNLYIVSPKNNKIPNDVICKDLVIEIKDYSMFKPNTLGDKIYAYTGFKNGWKLNDIDRLNQIQKQIDYEIITTNHSNLGDYYSIYYLKTNYYDKCFLNLNFNNGYGMTTVRELGLMGRKTIMNENHYKYPCIINYSNDNDLLIKIKEESNKIGTIQPSINSHTINDEWLNIEFWRN